MVPSEAIEKIMDQVSNCYTIDSSAEITLEANPDTLDAAYLRRLKNAGINRLSLGLQSLDDRELALLGRGHSSYQGLKAISQARDAGFDNLSLDLIYAIPGRKLSRWEDMLERVLDLGTEHLSFYGLTLDVNTPMGEACARGKIAQVNQDQAAAEYEIVSSFLSPTYFRQYEISNWSSAGAESIHNLIYWRRSEYLGLGAGAHSFIDSRRSANTDNLDEYIKIIDSGICPVSDSEFIDDRTALAESIILGLRLNEGVDISKIGMQFNLDILKEFATEIAELTGYDLLKINDGKMKLTERGRLLGNEVFIRFLS